MGPRNHDWTSTNQILIGFLGTHGGFCGGVQIRVLLILELGIAVRSDVSYKNILLLI